MWKSMFIKSDNPHMRLPLGAIGELLLEGPALARDYYHNITATSDAFVTGLRWAPKDARFYRTGDIVRSNNDGTFTFLRRQDHQIKFHGMRIELVEIEAKILSLQLRPLQDVCVEVADIYSKQALVAFCKTPSSRRGAE
jgi:acyl-CoA synthetase (AMP-forming)/AMP-acid ligase II